MGMYVNQTSKGEVGASFTEKCSALLNDGAILISKPTKFVPNIVCVVDNGFFAAAGYMYSEKELLEFSDPRDQRQKKWFIWDKVEKFAR